MSKTFVGKSLVVGRDFALGLNDVSISIMPSAKSGAATIVTPQAKLTKCCNGSFLHSKKVLTWAIHRSHTYSSKSHQKSLQLA